MKTAAEKIKDFSETTKNLLKIGTFENSDQAFKYIASLLKEVKTYLDSNGDIEGLTQSIKVAAISGFLESLKEKVK